MIIRNGCDGYDGRGGGGGCGGCGGGDGGGGRSNVLFAFLTIIVVFLGAKYVFSPYDRYRYSLT